MKYKTIREATEAWVRGFNAIPQEMIKKAYCNECFDEITEITPLSKYDRVYHFDSEEYGEITKQNDGIYTVELDNGSEVEVTVDEFEREIDDFLPMWGTMWTFGDGCDDWWLEKEGGLQIMADCGFRIYETEEGYIFGIDGCGYDFYEQHWVPLYKARGLQWHEATESIS